MRGWTTIPLLLLLAAMIPACTGEIIIGDPGVEVTTLGLSTLELGALQANRCVQLHGKQACAQYPNPNRCDQLLISIRGDGSTWGRCARQGQPDLTLSGAGAGIPIVCRQDATVGCVQCEDLYGGAVVDTCGERKTQLFSGKGFLSDKTGILVPGSGDANGSSAPPPPSAGSSACDVSQVKKAFVNKLNALLKQEGFTFSWSPDLSKIIGGGFFDGMGFHYADKICTLEGAPGVQDIASCDWDAKKQGRCYCEEDTYMLSCRCSRMTAEVLRALCALIPPGCDKKQWAINAYRIHGEALKYLTGGPLSGFNLGGAMKISQAKGPQEITCKGSPLVLDLAGDGIELSPVSEGVSFNLNNHGPVRTAWPRGNGDALLAMDGDGDGLITSGRELFGEGSAVDGRLARDGFEALAQLDRPEQGGNGNFLVDRGDLMFDQLVLWTDADHDGVCQPGELRSLSAAGISALQTRGRADTRVLDGGGNDLSLRARYLRTDGSAGLLVDALFVTRAR
jgi:hypothetical protein